MYFMHLRGTAVPFILHGHGCPVVTALSAQEHVMLATYALVCHLRGGSDMCSLLVCGACTTLALARVGSHLLMTAAHAPDTD